MGTPQALSLVVCRRRAFCVTDQPSNMPSSYRDFKGNRQADHTDPPPIPLAVSEGCLGAEQVRPEPVEDAEHNSNLRRDDKNDGGPSGLRRIYGALEPPTHLVLEPAARDALSLQIPSPSIFRNPRVRYVCSRLELGAGADTQSGLMHLTRHELRSFSAINGAHA